MELSAKTVYGPVLNITQHSAHAQNYVSVQPCRKSFTTIVLGEWRPRFPVNRFKFWQSDSI